MTSVFRPLLIEVPDVVLTDAVAAAKNHRVSEIGDKQEYQLYRLLTVKYVYASWAQLHRFASKREIISFIYESIRRLRGLHQWPDWDTPAQSTVDRRTREALEPRFGGLISGIGMRNRAYYPNPAVVTGDAERISLALANWREER